MQVIKHLNILAKRAFADHGFESAEPLIRPTQNPQHGDYQVNGAIALARKEKRPPREIADPIASTLENASEVSKAVVAGPGFINLTLSEDWLAQLLERAAKDESNGIDPVDEPKKIVVDYSAPNIAKQMHVGHLRSTIIGDSISNILEAVGHQVTRDNHIGDWGTQFGLLIVGMQRWGDDHDLSENPIESLEDLYRKASEAAKSDPSVAESARLELKKLQSGDPENVRLWKTFISATRVALDECYELLGVKFDQWRGESAYHDMLPTVVEDLVKNGIAREDNGAICVFWGELKQSPPDLRKQKEPFIVRKGDGAFLYSTTDIATAKYRASDLMADEAIYVVDSRQRLHFRQLFAVLDLLGLPLATNHVGFGMMLDENSKPLRTRDTSGKTVPLLRLLEEAVARAKERLSQENLDIPKDQLPNIAKIVGIGAVKYADLRQNRASDYQFSWDKLIEFKGNAGPYMQYAYARIMSIFRKSDGVLDECTGPFLLVQDEEKQLARALTSFSDAIHKAAHHHEPHAITDHLYALTRSFSSFYEACPVLKSEGAVKQSRLSLAATTARQIRHGLALLGIEVVERM